MKTFRKSLLGACAALAMAAPAFAQGPAPTKVALVAGQQQLIGIKVGIQPWTPLTNDDTVKTMVDDNALISNGLNKLWADNKQPLTDLIVSTLATPDLIYKGVSMYGINLDLKQPAIVFDTLSGTGVDSDPWHITMSIAVGGAMTTHFTSPEADVPVFGDVGLGKWSDLECGGEVGLSMRIPLIVSNQKGNAVRVDNSTGGPVVNITNVNFFGANLGCAAIVKTVDMLGFKDQILRKIKAKGATELNKLAQTYGPQGAALINAQITPYQRPEFDYGRLVMFSQSIPGGQKLVFGLSPRSPLPDPKPGAGVMSGTFRAGSGQFVCQSITISASRKTGPAPILNANWGLGAAPMEKLNAQLICGGSLVSQTMPGLPVAAPPVPYYITGLSANFPNQIVWNTPHDTCSTQNSSGKANSLLLQPEGYSGGSGDYVMPQHLAYPHNMVGMWTSITCPTKVMPQLPGNVKDMRDKGLQDPDYKTLPNSRVITTLPNIKTLPKDLRLPSGATTVPK